jgi:tRNA dimethylallyltransferase
LPLIVIAGPTASGKSALAVALSRLLPITIINADASQVYSDLQIISARPTLKEMEGAPHRLFGHIDGATACSAADWAEQARRAIAIARAQWRIPVLVGGTGLYIRTLLDGIAPVPEIDAQTRITVRGLPLEDAHAALIQEDPDAAARLSPNDGARIARALEVVRSTGKPLHFWQSENVGGIAHQVHLVPMILLPDRDWLYGRCNRRFEAMMAEDGLAEVQALLARGLDPDLPVMRAIGVPEIAAFLRGKADRDQTIEAGQIATRHYAKRQYTWFKNQPPPAWARHTAQLNAENINHLAIKLRQMTLTS